MWLSTLIFILSRVFPADCETGEDVVCALREQRAPPGSAGLGQSAVGGHVRSQTAHESARRGCVKGEGCREELWTHACASLCVLWSRTVPGKVWWARSSASLFSLYAVCTQSGPITHVALSQLGNDCTHSCGTQACKSTGCIIFPPDTVPPNFCTAEMESALFLLLIPCCPNEMHLNASHAGLWSSVSS